MSTVPLVDVSVTFCVGGGVARVIINITTMAARPFQVETVRWLL